MKTRQLPPVIGPLSLSPLTRDLWGAYDASAIAQLAPLADDVCYQQKFYKAPAAPQELMAGNGFAAFGMRVTPGSMIYGFYLPLLLDPADDPILWRPPAFTVQIRDTSLDHDWFDDPISSLFLANYKPCYQAVNSASVWQTGSFPNLLTAPYPVTGTGLFMVEIQSTSPQQQRIELVFGALEVCQ